MFNAISLFEQLVLNTKMDKVVGYVDLGSNLGRKNGITDHTLLFMIHGLKKP